jgi:hypothetical protein
MVFAALAGKAGTALVQAMAADDWEGVGLKVARLFGGGEPDPVIGRRLDATRQRLDAASEGELEQAQARLAAQWQTRFGDLLADHPDARIELAALVEELPEPAGATPQAIPDSAWETQTHNFIVGRYDRVQAAAQTWLTIMTTLFGVFSTVVVVSGPKTISDIHGGLPWRIGVAAGAAAVFVLAFAATMYGLFASWGGLGAGLKPEEKKNFWLELKEMWQPEPLDPAETIAPGWKKYRDKYTVDRANQNRKRLHRSRILGVTAVTCAGGLALALIANGFVG